MFLIFLNWHNKWNEISFIYRVYQILIYTSDWIICFFLNVANFLCGSLYICGICSATYYDNVLQCILFIKSLHIFYDPITAVPLLLTSPPGPCWSSTASPHSPHWWHVALLLSRGSHWSRIVQCWKGVKY